MLVLGVAAFALGFFDTSDPVPDGSGVVRPVDDPGRGAIRPQTDRVQQAEGPDLNPALGASSNVDSGGRREVGNDRSTQLTGARQTIAGLVVGDGRPIAGAQVLFSTRDGKALTEATSDARGNFELAPSHPLEDGLILVQARGFAPLETGPHAIRSGERRFVGNLQITRGVMLRGRVTDPSGTPLAEARVNLRAGGPGGGFNRHVQEAIADAQGNFRFPIAPLGMVRVEAYATGYGSRSKELRHAEPKDNITVELAPERAMLIVVHDSRGDVVEGAAIHLRPHDPGSPPMEAFTDADGTCNVLGLGSNVWEARVDAPGYRPAIRDRVAADGNPVEFELLAWPCVRGRVSVPGGASLPEGTTVVPLTSNARGAFIDSGRSSPIAVEPDGTFALCDLRPGLYVVRAVGEGWAATDSSTVRLTLGMDANDVSIELHKGGTLDLLVEREGAALGGASVALYDRSPPATELYRTPKTPLAPSSLQPINTLRTGADGHVTFEHLARGTYWCLVRADGLLPVLHGPAHVDENRVEKTGPVELSVGGRLHGNLTGLPESSHQAFVNIFGEAGIVRTPIMVQAGEDGSWTSPSLPVGSYRLSARVLAGQPPRALTASAQARVESGKKIKVELTFQ